MLMVLEKEGINSQQKVYQHEPDEKKTIDGEGKKKEWPKKGQQQQA